MNDLSSLNGGQMPGNLGTLVQMFEQGQHQQAPDQQVQQAYGQVASQLPQDEYLQAAEAAFQRLSPEQRAEFARQLQAQAQQAGVQTPAVASASSDPGSLARATTDVHAQQPNLLQQMFAPGGTFSNPIAKAALLGITAMAAQRLMPGRR
jgi:hypothetical protein